MTEIELAIFMHNNYEKIAKKTGWNTQKSCKVDFNDLPDKNKETMIILAYKILKKLGCEDE